MFRPPSKPNPSQQSTPVTGPMDKYPSAIPSKPRPTFSKSKCERFLLFGLDWEGRTISVLEAKVVEEGD